MLINKSLKLNLYHLIVKLPSVKSNSVSLKPGKDSSASLKSTKKLVVPCTLFTLYENEQNEREILQQILLFLWQISLI